MSNWLVTARHLDPRHPEGRYPWGDWHIRLDRTDFTACGLSTAGWRTFWHLRFEAEAEKACETCAAAIGAPPRQVADVVRPDGHHLGA